MSKDIREMIDKVKNFKQIIKEEVTNSTPIKITLYTNENGTASTKSKETTTNQMKIEKLLQNNTPVEFTIRYVTQQGVDTVDLVNGSLTPDSRGEDGSTDAFNRKRLNRAEVVEINLFSKYSKQKANYKGKDTIQDAIKLIMRYGQDSAENFIKQNQKQPSQQQLVSEGLKLKNYFK